VNLLSRILKLESQLNKSVQPVNVAFQKVGEADDEFEINWKAQNHGTGALLILIKFVESNS